MKSVLDIDNLSYIYKTSNSNYEVFLENLNLKKGDICTLTGVSGSGKSTLLECIGLLRPKFYAQKFYLDNVDALSLNEEEKAKFRASFIGYMPQSGGLIPYLTVKENLALQIKLALGKNYKKDFFKKRLLEMSPLLDRFGMLSKINEKPYSLSIGQRQRASFFRALAHNPQLILIDEPTSALDPINAHKLFETIVDCAKSLNIAVLAVTHEEYLKNDFELLNVSYKANLSSLHKSVFSR